MSTEPQNAFILLKRHDTIFFCSVDFCNHLTNHELTLRSDLVYRCKGSTVFSLFVRLLLDYTYYYYLMLLSNQ